MESANVRFGSKADIGTAIGWRVRFRRRRRQERTVRLRPDAVIRLSAIADAPRRVRRAENRPFVLPAWLFPFTTLCRHFRSPE